MRCVYTLLRKHRHIALYCRPPRALSGIMRRHSVSRRLKTTMWPVYKGEIPFTIGNFHHKRRSRPKCTTAQTTPVALSGTTTARFYHRHRPGMHISARRPLYAPDRLYLVIESNYDLGDAAPQLISRKYLAARAQTHNGHTEDGSYRAPSGRNLHP